MKRPKTETEFNLAAVRQLKRLTKRVVKGLEAIEKHLLKVERSARGNPGATAEEVKAAEELYRLASLYQWEGSDEEA